MNTTDDHQQESPYQTGPTTMLVYFLCTFVASTVTSITAMMMALGTGLGSTPDDPVPAAATALWAIGGLAFLPNSILVIALVATHRRIVGNLLAFTIIGAGLSTAIGWFIRSGWEMPGNRQGDVILLLVIGLPLILGLVIFTKSRSLKP